MYIEKRIKLNNNFYYIIVDVEYKKDNEILSLRIKNYKDDYWDDGDCSILIEQIEKNYTSEKAKTYDNYISFMADCLYIYDRIPFLSGIKDVYISSKDNLPYSKSYISKDEIEKYIKDNNVTMTTNTNFKLFDSYTWNL